MNKERPCFISFSVIIFVAFSLITPSFSLADYEEDLSPRERRENKNTYENSIQNYKTPAQKCAQMGGTYTRNMCTGVDYNSKKGLVVQNKTQPNQVAKNSNNQLKQLANHKANKNAVAGNFKRTK